MTISVSSQRLPVASVELPLTLIPLDEWCLVNLQGPDRISYLQGQVTQDVAALTPRQHQLCAHCDAKGKMWSNMRLFHRGETLSYIERCSVRDTQIAELKKYAIFAKVTIEADQHAVLLGIAGHQAREVLATLFEQLPDADSPVVGLGDTTLLHFALPTERFLLITSAGQAADLQQRLANQVQLSDSQQWLALEIEAGLPVIDAATSAQHIPQAVNLQALDAINFKKGCYTGQEMVARAKYRGANKRAMYWLAGQATVLPDAGGSLEIAMGGNWRRTGTVLAAIRLESGEVWIQAVLNNDLEPDARLRVKDDHQGSLTVVALPYSLE